MTTPTHLTEPAYTALGRLTTDPAAFRVAPSPQPVVCRAKGGFTDLFGWDELDAVLASGGRRLPDFRVIRDGAQLPDHRYTRDTLMHSGVPDVRKAAAELAEGASLVMQGLQEYIEPIARFTRSLAHDLSRPVHVNAYVTPPKSQGFAAHFDPRDAFVLQVEGTKVWTLREPVLPRPLAHESWQRLQERPEWNTARLEALAPWQVLTLEPGDCLWLPRGWVHSARSEGVSSLHLTFSLTAWTEHWAVRELMSRIQAPGRDTFAADFVRDPETAVAAVATLRRGLADWFAGTTDEEIAKTLRTAAIREFPVPLHQASAVLADDAIADDTEFVAHPEAVLSAVVEDDRLVLHLADRVLSLPAVAEPLIAEIFRRGQFTLAALASGGSVRAGEDVVRRIWREGLVSRA